MSRHKFTISLEPLNEPDRKHWCAVVGCQEQVLFADEDRWVCWPHGQLKLREDRQWWTHEPLDATVHESPPKARSLPITGSDLQLLMKIIEENSDIDPLISKGYSYSTIATALGLATINVTGL